MTVLSVIFNWDQKKTLVEQLWLDKEDQDPELMFHSIPLSVAAPERTLY